MASKKYKVALQHLAQRTGTPLPSLVVSFAVLHELTAIIPFTTFYCVARSSGLGSSVLEAVHNVDKSDTTVWKVWFRDRVEDGEDWAKRVGRRYGIWESQQDATTSSISSRTHFTGELANAVIAYVATKVGYILNWELFFRVKFQALLPLRLGASLYFAPVTSRRIVQPLLQRLGLSRFRNKGT